MGGGVTILSYIEGFQPYLKRLDRATSVRSSIYVNQRALRTVEGARATFATIAQDAIIGIGYPYTRQFTADFHHQTKVFFDLDTSPPFAPPSHFPTILPDPIELGANEYQIWARPLRGDGAIMYSKPLHNFYASSRKGDWDYLWNQVGSGSESDSDDSGHPSPSPSSVLTSSRRWIPRGGRTSMLSRATSTEADLGVLCRPKWVDLRNDVIKLENKLADSEDDYACLKFEYMELKEQLENMENQAATHEELIRDLTSTMQSVHIGQAESGGSL